MISDFAEAGLIGGLFFLLALPAFFRRKARPWAILLVLLAAADAVLVGLPTHFPALQFLFPASDWNWSGKLLSFALAVIAAIVLVGTGRFSARDMGFSILQEHGTARAMMLVVVPILLLLAVLTATLFGGTAPVSKDTLAFQATMPGLAEECMYRGVLLALLDKAFPARFRLGGAVMGYGAVAVSVVFGFGHGVKLDSHLVLHTALVPAVSSAIIGFLLVWVRMRTRSLVMPVIVHNAINVIFTAVPRLV